MFMSINKYLVTTKQQSETSKGCCKQLKLSNNNYYY